MRRCGLIFLLLAPLFGLQCLYASEKSLTLAEKLAIAKRMADDAVAGKAEMGRVVSGGFSFNDIVKEYRSKEAQGTPDIPLTTGGDITQMRPEPLKQESSAQEEGEPLVEKIPVDSDVKVERIEAERLRAEVEEKSDFIKKRAFEEKTEILELDERPESFPKIESSTKGISADAGKDSLGLQAQHATKPSADADLKDSVAEPKAGKSGIKPERDVYVVDTSGDDFINGYFVGKIDGKQVKSDKKDSPQILEKKETEPSPKQRYYSAQNGMFYLVTDNHAAIGIGYDFIRMCAALFDAYFSETGSPIVFTRKITLQLVSNKDFKIDGDFSVMLYDDGEITLAAKWSDDLDFDGFCKLLTGAALRKVSLESGGLENWKNPPYWLELAMAQALAQEMRFGTAVDLARIAADNPPPDMKSILKFSRSDKIDTRIMDAHSYWMLRSVEKAARTRQALAGFLKFALKNSDADKTEAAFASEFVPSFYDFDTWWRCLITGEIWARLGGVNTPDWSDSEIMRLAIIQTDSQSGERVGVSDLDIFENREFILDELEARLMEIKVAMPKMNPLYYNSLVSLGRMYEAALDGDEDDFKAAHSDFLAEYKNARDLSAAVKDMMREDIASVEPGKDESAKPEN